MRNTEPARRVTAAGARIASVSVAVVLLVTGCNGSSSKQSSPAAVFSAITSASDAVGAQLPVVSTSPTATTGPPIPLPCPAVRSAADLASVAQQSDAIVEGTASGATGTLYDFAEVDFHVDKVIQAWPGVSPAPEIRLLLASAKVGLTMPAGRYLLYVQYNNLNDTYLTTDRDVGEFLLQQSNARRMCSPTMPATSWSALEHLAASMPFGPQGVPPTLVLTNADTNTEVWVTRGTVIEVDLTVDQPATVDPAYSDNDLVVHNTSSTPGPSTRSRSVFVAVAVGNARLLAIEDLPCAPNAGCGAAPGFVFSISVGY